ncbi:response regulator transcription factor [Plectonema cf. radiosum LEGE 06105]|uniref:Response regulator transcription factor n=1 Tax=Plectonema cf. radiosum LEGE 06105 TaxID=945769 RepID=A0A8J7F0Y6_9CYAN|nr:response regulator transcription factor [Plectonema radiosum]MBE9213868.1 response regulator transcription factor [Plectonema cf. radiosum LEGE 06105]
MNEIRVVIIEDHNLTRIGLRAALETRETIKIIGEASNGNDGLNLLKSLKPDVATIDLGLPDIDGIELTRRFRQYQAEIQNEDTKLLVLTMQNSDEAVLAAFGAGADSYCMKDIESDKLVEAVEATASSSSWIDPTIADIVLRQVREEVSQGKTSADAKTVAIQAVDPEVEKVIETYPLTKRELEVLELIVSGCDNAEIAKRLYLTIGTVKTHVRGILSKLCVDDRTQAAVRALRSGIVQ